MTYKQALDYIDSFIDYEKLNNYAYNKSFGLERISRLLERLGNPQDGLRCIHVAGTKGKGSTSAFIAYILAAAGYRTGLYTSPHLEDFRERIRILEQKRGQAPFQGMISKRDLTRLVELCRDAINRISTPTFFEIYTALAFLYFKEKKVDFVVLETGLGGRLDATNVVNPLVSVITSISLEHTQYLGKTLQKIAEEKAGIIKNNKIVVSAPQEKEVLEVIRTRCRTVGAELFQPSIDRSLKPRLLGSHQLLNASVAKAAVEALELNIKPSAIKQGIRRTVWPGRCEVVARKPLIVLDGAQNVASAKALKRAVREHFRYKKSILVLGICSDKDVKGVCGEFCDFADVIVLTRSANPRAMQPQHLAEFFKAKDTHITNGIKEARAIAQNLAEKEDLILVTGSLYLVGEARKVLRSAQNFPQSAEARTSILRCVGRRRTR